MKKSHFLSFILILLIGKTFAQSDSSQTITPTSGWGGFTLIGIGYNGMPGVFYGGMGGISSGNLLFGGFGYGGNITVNKNDVKSLSMGIGGVILGHKGSINEQFGYNITTRLGYGGGSLTDVLGVNIDFGVFRANLSLGSTYKINEVFTLLLTAGYDYNVSTSDTPQIASDLNSLNITFGIIFGIF